MIQEQKIITYQGRIVFEKLTLGRIKRIPKFFQENEACFMFVNKGEFSARTANVLIPFQPGQGLLSKCFNYFYEANQQQQDNTEEYESIGVFLYPDMMEDLFKFEIFSSSFNLKSNLKRVNLDAFLFNYKESINLLLDNPELADEALIRAKLKGICLIDFKNRKCSFYFGFSICHVQSN